MGTMCVGNSEDFQKECQATIPSLISPDFNLQAKRLKLPISISAFMKMKEDEKEFYTAYKHKYPKQTLHDGRTLQATYGSAAEMFQHHGFCILQHKTEVKVWNDDHDIKESDISQIYHGEIENLVKNQLYPNDNDKIHLLEQPGAVLRRGKGTKVNFYANGCHQDFGINDTEYEVNIKAHRGEAKANEWKDKFYSDDVSGQNTICFWRVTGMNGPLQFKPLAVCDPTTVDRKDQVPTALVGFPSTIDGADTAQGSLRYNPNQKWYYFPEMTNNEVMVFKQFEYFKERDNVPDAPEKTCFHTAFDHPSTPWFCEKRQSCEHRISLFWNKEPYA